MTNSKAKCPRIGVFDSGIGGLSILQDLYKLLPCASYYYIADHAFAPYGHLTEEKVKERVQILVEKLVFLNYFDVIVIACNTATAVAIDATRSKFPKIPFVGVEPYVNILNKDSSRSGKSGRKIVLTTALLAKNQRFLNLLKQKDEHNLFSVFPCPNLAGIVEEAFEKGFDDKMVEKIRCELLPLAGQKIDFCVMGCTHYPLVSKTIEKILQTECIDSGLAVARRVKQLLPDFNADSCAVPNSFYFESTRDGKVAQVDFAIFEQWPK